MHKTIGHSAAASLEAAFTSLRPKDPDQIVPGSSEHRDEMVETDWFPIFRSGVYPQGTFTGAQVQEIAAEMSMSGRRSPIVFDHLNEDDLKPDAKPGSAAGYVIEARAVADTSANYAGETLLEVRAKVGWSAKWATRDGAYRNCSIGLGKATGRDGVQRYCIHHLALLGAAPPGVDGLPELIFSSAGGETNATAENRVLFFGLDEAGASTHTPEGGLRVSMIAFKDHQEALDKQAVNFREQISSLDAKFKAADEAKAAAEKVAEDAKAAAEAALAEAEQAKKDAETAKADAVVAVEAAKQEGHAAGIQEGLHEGERRFSAEKEKAELVAFCQGLRETGRVTEQELEGLPELILGLPADQRGKFKSLLSNRPGVPSGANFANGAIVDPTKPEDENAEEREAKILDEAKGLVSAGKFSSLRDAIPFVRSNLKKGEG